ncbi:NAD(P)H-dependent oxidoreductase [Rhodobacteraceae bacterium M382]|nr:NAD(P)H-dependent oxidoreductase [Rhodobacteraceae bacterium M382]
MTHTLLHIDSSARFSDSASRILSSQIVDHLTPDQVIRRDLAQQELPQISETWIGANFTPADLRTDAQTAALAQSDALVDELIAADTIVIGLPVYNFSAPASLKLWIDLVARVGRTFHYTETGPQGLLTGKRAIVAYASGGVPMGAPVDFASTYLTQVLNFVGITEIEFVAAEGTAADATAALTKAQGEIAKLAA